MRILLISTSYPPVLGGLETVVYNIACGLKKKGHVVRVATNSYQYKISGQCIEDGIYVSRLYQLTPDIIYNLKQGRLNRVLLSILFFPVALFRLVKLIITFRPEVIGVRQPRAYTFCLRWLKKRYNFRLVVSLHSDDVLTLDSQGTISPILRHLFRQADSVTACSYWLLRQACTLYPVIIDKGRVIYNGIDQGRFLDTRAYPHPRPYVFAFGRLAHVKGFDLLIQAFAKVADDFPELDLIIAGEGECRRLLEDVAESCSVSNRVVFFGRANPNEVVHLLNGCEFVVVSSRYEPFGIVALEAMAAKKSVIVTRVGGLPEFVETEGNRFVDPTVSGLADGMRDFLESGYGSLSKVDITRFSWECIVAEYEKILRGAEELK